MPKLEIHKTFPVSEREKNKINLGTLPHIKRTQAYKVAEKFFEDEKKRLHEGSCIIHSSSHIAITDTTVACKVDVYIYYVDIESDTNTLEDAFDMFGDVFGDSGNMFEGFGDVKDSGDIFKGFEDLFGKR